MKESIIVVLGTTSGASRVEVDEERLKRLEAETGRIDVEDCALQEYFDDTWSNWHQLSRKEAEELRDSITLALDTSTDPIDVLEAWEYNNKNG